MFSVLMKMLEMNNRYYRGQKFNPYANPFDLNEPLEGLFDQFWQKQLADERKEHSTWLGRGL